jgi:hypothetical protein
MSLEKYVAHTEQWKTQNFLNTYREAMCRWKERINQTLKEEVVRMSNGFSQIRIHFSGGIYERGNKISGHTRQEYSCSVKRILNSI